MRPPQTGTTVRPPQTGPGPAAVRPSQTGTTVRPPQTGPGPAAVRPPQTGTTVRPPQTGTTVRPPQTGPGPAQVNPPRPDGDADAGPDRASLSPEQVPLGLGLQVDRQVVEQVEVLTRGQSSNQDWFTWRKNRITASVAHRIAHCRFVNGKSKAPPASYVAAVTGEGRSVQTRAMSWGVQMEAAAVRRYQEMKSAALGRSVSVQDCGLFIDARRPWLAASPDGIVTDSQTGQWLLCLEVKCPYKHRQRTVEDACREDPAFCLEITDHTPPASRLKSTPSASRLKSSLPVYRLKTSHSYYTQIQVQLAVTGLRDAELAVFTLKELAIVPVTFDPALWDATLSKLETFYRDAVLPHLRQDTQRDAAAAPEL
uniref:YqaJ viral recombinase domain-containing protein n=1 Tax=Sander lucioperca TaxID=283035 RepID=A0A8D0CWJ7_SANLU